MKSCACVLPICALALGLASIGQAVAERQLPWYQEVTMFHFPHFYVTDLATDTFQSLIQNSTAEYVLVDFYAPWCPHCQHFAPEYERLALAVNRFENDIAANAGARPRILCAEVDCVRSAGTCNRFGIHSFPTLLWGKKSDWLNGSVQEVHSGYETAEAAGDWINKRLNIRIDPSKISRQEVIRLRFPSSKEQSPSKPEKPAVARADVWDAQLATALLLRGAFAEHYFPPARGAGPKETLLDFIALLAERFPEARQTAGTPCRNSLSALHRTLVANWSNLAMYVEGSESVGDGVKLFKLDPDELEESWRLCGSDWAHYRRGFGACRGTFPGKRGFTCGLWTLFHMLAARTDDVRASNDTNVVRAMISHFFDCTECREHFLKIEFRAEDAKDKRSAQLWWWNAHNLVNDRVGRLEKLYQDGDPLFPKMAWPTVGLCPDCRNPASSASFLQAARRPEAPIAWRPDRVMDFLDSFYG
uniref:Sulfhydryl oxidase n=1 Tax=Pyrodinium bahamense TaxID=73915 RepID=A0A7S0A417_9DINO|mmetsp:Transcript_21102/g.58480  ORF Transcript_21102/g.58480 Transcript_21102/m.58480 type:complete len:474 (-) Transcript_21102:96-1517(-)